MSESYMLARLGDRTYLVLRLRMSFHAGPFSKVGGGKKMISRVPAHNFGGWTPVAWLAG